MTTPTTPSAASENVSDVAAGMFAGHWLHGSRHLAVRTTPIVAVVHELATILRDEQVPAPQALLALRRAVRLLAVLADGTRADFRHEAAQIRGGVPDVDDVAGSAGSTAFAAAWLRGSSAEAIRTEPVIAVVENLLGTMTYGKVPASQAYHTLRRAVRVLSVFARESDTAAGGSPQ